MIDRIVHGSYPVDYFSLDGVDRIEYPSQSWWASRQRFAAVDNTGAYKDSDKGGSITSEYLEIDLGRVRQINFLTMQVFKVPVNISIMYDSVSAQDGTHEWVAVKPMQEMEYDSKVRYRPEHKNPFEKCNYYFTDINGRMVNTRYLRIKFRRVDAAFPTKKSKPVRYAVQVKGLRTARVVANYQDTAGPIFNSGIDEFTEPFGFEVNKDPDVAVEGASELLKQNFVVAEDSRRGAAHADEEDPSQFPSIIGFGLLVHVEADEDADAADESEGEAALGVEDAELVWEIRDITDMEQEVVLRRGTVTTVANRGRCWVDVYFPENPIDADVDSVYQVRLQSRNMPLVGSAYRHQPNNLPGREIPGLLNWVAGSATVTTTADTTAVVKEGDRIMKPSGEGGFFEVMMVDAMEITLMTPFTGTTQSNGRGIVIMPMFHYMEGTANLIENGGGESGVLGSQAPGWTKGVGNDLVVADDFEKVGVQSLKINNGSAADSRSHQTFSVLADHEYEVSGWIRTSALPTGDAGHGAAINIEPLGALMLESLEKEGSTLIASEDWDVGIEATGSTVEWTFVRSRFMTDRDGSINVHLQLGYGGTQSGTAWFDDMSFRRIGMYMPFYDHNLTMRLWGDVADSGRDVLGNEYRYATHRDKAKYVFDGTRAGWVCAPMPDPNAVESLYFDVRTDTAGVKSLTVIDALRIAPLVPGVQMHVYYCDGWLNSAKPGKIEEWENLFWKPIPWTFTLHGDQQFGLPQQIAASFIKLEFTALKPRPFRIPTYPALPPVHYRRYPTWVEAQFENAQVRRIVNDWFVRHRTRVMRNVLKTIDDPLARFQYKLREFLAALALGKQTFGRKEAAVKAGLVDLKHGAYIDPVTASKIYVTAKSLYKGTLKVNVDVDSLLGQMVTNLYDSRVVGDPVEGEVNFSDTEVVPIVSSVNERVTESYAHLARTPMWFNRPARHRYRRDSAKFNKKAFFCGVAEVDFLRSDFTVARDDEVISETFADEAMIASNTFELEAITEITSGQTLYVSYDIPNPGFVQDEKVVLTGTDPVRLSQTGDEPAINVRVFSAKNFQDEEYLLGRDFDLSFDTDTDGKTVNFIERQTQFKRTRVRRPAEGYTFVDAGMVVGQARVPIIRGYEDENVVIGRSIIFSATHYTDAATVTGTGLAVTTLEEKVWFDAATVTGITSVPAGADGYSTLDAATATSVGAVSAIDLTNLGDPADGGADFLDAVFTGDNFTRDAQSDWGTASGGFVWATTSPSDFSTNGTQGLITVPLTNIYGRLQTVAAGGRARANVRVYAEVSWNVAAVGADHQFSLYGRQSTAAADRGYRVRIDQQTDGSVRLSLLKTNDAGTSTLLAGPTTIASSYTLGNVYKVKLEITGTTVRAKAWLNNTIEPAAWTLSVTDSEITAAGDVAVRASRTTGSTASGLVFTVDNFIVTTDVSKPVGVGVPSGVEDRVRDDAATTTGIGVPSTTEDFHTKVDAGTETGVAVVSGVDQFEGFDG